jgi:protein-tyrosine-phosphatase
MAEALLRHMLEKEGIGTIEILSRGLSTGAGHPMTHEAIEVLKKAGIPTRPHQSKNLDVADTEKADWIYAMTNEHLSAIAQRFPAAKHKARRLADTDIADPLGGSRSDYEKCRIEIQNALLDLIRTFKSEGSSKP